MPVTASKSISFPDSTYPVSPLENLFSSMATSVDTALTTLQQATASSVSNQAARDAIFPSPVQGNSTYRQDLGWYEMYYAAYSSSSNPGGAKTPGWYPAPNQGPMAMAKNDGSGTVGTAYARFGGWTTVNSLGMGVTAANGQVTMPYEGFYDISYSVGTANSGASAYMLQAGSAAELIGYVGPSTTAVSGGGIYPFASGDTVSPYALQSTSAGVRADRTYLSVQWAGVRQSGATMVRLQLASFGQFRALRPMTRRRTSTRCRQQPSRTCAWRRSTPTS